MAAIPLSIQPRGARFMRRFSELAADDLPYVSLWWDDNVAAMDRRLTGFEPYPNGSLISLATASFCGPNRETAAARANR